MFKWFNRWFPLVYLANNWSWRTISYSHNSQKEVYANISPESASKLLNKYSSWVSFGQESLEFFWLFRRGTFFRLLIVVPLILNLYYSPIYQRLVDSDGINLLHLVVFLMALYLLVYIWHVVGRLGYQYISLESNVLCWADGSLFLSEIVDILKINKDIFLVYVYHNNGRNMLIYAVDFQDLPDSEQKLWKLIYNTYVFKKNHAKIC